MKGSRHILLLLLLFIMAQGARADRFVATTTTPIGSKIKMTLCGSNLTLTGLKGSIAYDQEASYEVTAQTFSIEGNIAQVYCYLCNITSLDLSDCPKLEGLGCQGNQITTLDLSSCESLAQLFCEGNPLKRLDVSHCPKLGRLNCVQCALEELIMSGCSKLFEISCYQNRLTEMDLTGLNNLRWLYCFKNRLKSIDTSPCPLLIKVLCEYNQISSLDFSKNSALDEVACQGNNLRGATLTAICKTLPDRTDEDLKGIFMVVDTKEPEDTNICTVSQVALLKQKGWNAMDSQGGANNGFGVPYEGSQDNAIGCMATEQDWPRIFLNATELTIDPLPLGASITIYNPSGATCYQHREDHSTQLTISTMGWMHGLYLLYVSGLGARTFSL